ncbi:MAG: endolytic transglycosylase MltG [Gemmatimonadales bacterium]|nr:endolytic transglycosylase MltG [Gemmatimonadales bacterium]
MSTRHSWSALLILAVGMLLLAAQACVVPDPEDAIWIRIPAGDPVEAVAESLAAHGIVASAEAFEDFARIGRKHLGIKPGVYPFRPGTPMGRVLVDLRKGRPDAVRIRVKEGVWLSELAPVLARVLDLPVDSLIAAARDSTLRARLGTTAESVEGYLPPATYYIPVKSTPAEVWRQLADAFEEQWKPEWDARLDTLGLTRHQLVTLASIVEGEGGNDGERALISSVYHNRLVRGLRLQADPTVVYALGSRNRLYNKHYGFDSPYNTYRVDGLPPGPIGQPSRASILAALYPAETEFLYFVATRDGHHEFSRSYREHLATIRTVRKR